jgi:NADH-quinone oxidoreductase subunit H
VLGILTAGWSSNNKYALLGGLRSAAQLISYELPLALGIIWAAMVAGTLSTVGIVEAQIQQGGWFLFTLPPPIGRLGAPFGILAAVTFLVAATAEVNRVPFDLPEAESELVAGYFVEYTGMRFALFQLGEYGEMFGMAALAVIMFLGGWAEPHLAPYLWVAIALGAVVLAAVILLTARHSLIIRPVLILAALTAAVSLLMSVGIHLPSIVWFLLKLFSLVFFLMWVRWTYPRLRLDQLLNLSWKVLLPLGLLNLLATGLILTLGGR